MAKNASYSAKDIQQLTDIERVRRFPARFLGSEPFTTAVREIVDNALDEVARGFATFVGIEFHEDGSVEVSDDGRGLPVDFDPDFVTQTGKRGANGIVKALGVTGSGGNYAAATAATAGVHGEGGAASNFVSKRFDVRVLRDGKMYHQAFRCGVPGDFEGDGFDPQAAFCERECVQLRGERVGGGAHGTSIRMSLDRGLAPDAGLDVEGIIQRANIAARLRGGMTLQVTTPEGTTVYDGGDSGAAAVYQYAFETKPTAAFTCDFTYTNQGKDVAATIELAVAPSVEPQTVSTVNTVLTPNHGAYVTHALRGVGKGLASKPVRGLKRDKGEEYPSPEHFAAVAQSAVALSMAARPKFDGQDKSALTYDRSMCVALSSEMERKVSLWAALPENSQIVAAFAQAALDYARRERKIEAVRQRSKKSARVAESSTLNLPDKFLPCKNMGAGSGAELHLTEGDSALGTFRAARDPLFQAGYPMKGRPPASWGVALNKLMQNEVFASIAALLDCGIRESCKPEDCRFDHIVITTDADPDGAGIASSLAAMFIANYLPLVEQGRVLISCPPLFIVTTEKADDRVYCQTERERDEAVAAFRAAGRKKPSVQRCKGLGEMTPRDFAETVLDPDTRTLRQVSYEPGRDLADLETIYGASPSARRSWIAARMAEGYPTDGVDVTG